MTTALSLLLLPLGLLLLAAALLLLVQGFATLLPERRDTTGSAPQPAPSHVVLMPAHNEEGIIQSTAQHVMTQLGPQGRLLVIADNCTDNTASRARATGAEVSERFHATNRGKGFALAHGIAQLAQDPPQVVLVLDADCEVQPGSLDMLAVQAHARQRPVQARYDMLAPEGAGLKQRMAAFAWDFRNRFRAEGYRRLGLPCQLMGSGMAFPWPLLQGVNLNNGHLVEDLKLGLDFALNRHAPVLFPSAFVFSQFPTNQQGAQSQRQRWEHGHIGMVISQGPPLFGKAVATGNGPLLAMVLDMCVPPLALLVMLAGFYSALVGVLALLGWVAPWLTALGLLSLVLIGSAVAMGWWRVGRRWIGALELLTAPLYALRKVPLYLGFFFKRQSQWIRTRRD